VSRADVSFRDREARVTFDTAQVSVDQLIEAVKRLGFGASLKRAAAERRTSRFLGAPMRAPEAADSIQTAALAIRQGLTVQELAEESSRT
jgi:mercuric reductase